MSPMREFNHLHLQTDNSPVLEEDLGLYFSSIQNLSVATDDNRKDCLGQVFTPRRLAKFMAALVAKNIHPKAKVLDPCIGKNVFFNEVVKFSPEAHFVGVELDDTMISNETLSFYEPKNRSLIQGSFFDLPLSEKFDVVIQNPPYVRQELLRNGHNAKTIIRSNSEIRDLIPPQSNLYFYFLVKAILHLRQGGVMAAVIYDSWLYSAFGEALKSILARLGTTNAIYHFKKNAFDNVEVGATVILFTREVPQSNSYTKYYSLDSLDDIKGQNRVNTKPEKITKCDFRTTFHKQRAIIKFDSGFFLPIREISEKPIQRGVSAISNSHFLFTTKEYPECQPIVKDVSKVEKYLVSKETQFVLAVNGSCSPKTKQYLKGVENEILEAGNKYTALKERILTGQEWHKVKLKSTGNFIFNYYMRNNIDFIYNPNLLCSSDNFYALNINDSPLAHLALLNSSFTRLGVLYHSRNQGNGLRKIQLYEFKNVPVINHSQVSRAALRKLTALGKQLQKLSRYSKLKSEVIQKIDAIILKEYNAYTGSTISLEDLVNAISSSH